MVVTPEMWAPQRQRTRTDCGIACLATVACVPYDMARSAMFGGAIKRSFRSKYDAVVIGGRALGLVAGPRKRWTLEGPTHGRGMLCVWACSDTGSKTGHWLAWLKTPGEVARTYDPAIDFIGKWTGVRCHGFTPRTWFMFEPAPPPDFNRKSDPGCPDCGGGFTLES